MNLLPVIARELRSQARQPATYHLRLATMTLLIGIFALLTIWGQASQGAQVGRQLFFWLNVGVCYVIWLGAPLLVADAISGEKREGTLGLLFLTSLQAADVVLGKGLILSWRAFGLLLAGLPVLVLPFLFGGVSWRLASFMLGYHLLALLTALTAGLTASALSRHFVRAVLSGVFLSAAAAFLFHALLGLLCFQELGDFWSGVSVLGRVMQELDRAGWRSLGRAMAVHAGIWVLLTAALFYMIVLQVEGFWGEGHLTSRRARQAAASWVKMLVWAGVVLTMLVFVFAFWRRPEQGVMAAASVLSGGFSLVCWIGPVMAVFRYALQERERAGLPLAKRSPAGLAQPAPAWSWARFGCMLLGGTMLVLVVEMVILRILPLAIAIVVVLNHVSVVLLMFGVSWLAWGWGRNWMRAVVRGIALGILVFVLWCLASAMVMAHANARVEPDGWHSFFQLGWHQIFLVGAMVQSGSYLFAAFELGRQFDPWWWLLDSLGLLMLSALVSLVCAVIGMRWAGRAPRLEPDDPGASFVRDLNEPLFAKGFFRRRRDRVLEKNPMRWLLERSRTARLHRAGWLALVTVVESVMTLDGRALDISALALWQQGLLLALSVGLAVSSGMSFLEEKRTGAMELILVTPLQVRQIIFGRWRGLLGQFIPSLFLVGLVLLFSYSIRLSWQRAEPLSYVMGETGLFSFVSVPFVGMLASMLFRNLAASLAMTLAVPLLNFLSFVALLWLGSLVETPGHVPVEEAVVRYVQVTGWFLILPLNVWVAVKACQKLALLLGARTSRA